MKPFSTLKSIFLWAALLMSISFSCNLHKVEDPEIPCTGADAVTADFEADKLFCEVPCEITFLNKSEGASTYAWDFDNTLTSNSLNPGKILFNTAGNYTVRLIASNNKGCADTAELSITIVDPQMPTVACATIAAQTNSGGAPSTFSFSAACTQNAGTYNWDFGDPGSGAANTATGINTEHLYAAEGNYTVKLSVQGPVTSDDTTFVVSVKPPQPQASFAVVNDGCDAPCTVQFSNTSLNAVSYQWDFGNGGNSTQVSPAQIYAGKGIYTVRLIAIGADGARDTAFQDVTVIKLPIAGFSFSNNNCVVPCSVAFTENSQFETSYIWDFGDGTPISTSANPAHTYVNKGTYSVRLIAVNPDGSDTATQSVTILSPNYKAVIDINGSDVTPMLGVERTDGQTHVLFLQGGAYKSVLISPDKTVGNVAIYNFPDLSDFNEVIDSKDGGFALVGSNAGSTRATLIKVGSTQNTAFSKLISFTGSSQLSQGQGVMLNASNQYVVTGSYIPTGGGDMFPGFAFVSQSGTVSGNTFVNTPAATIGAVWAEGITQLNNGQYMLIANQWSFGSTKKRYLVLASSSGGYSSNKNLGTSDDIQLYQIFSVDNSAFVRQTVSGVPTIVKYNTAFNALGSISLNGILVSQMMMASDGNIIVCGTKNGSAWLAKYNSSTMSATPIWERNYAEASGTTGGIAVTRLANGGYLLTGTHNSATGQKRLYIVKTDNFGNVN